MKHILAALLLVVVVERARVAAEPAFRLTVSGTLASKLEPDTKLQFWSAWEK